MIVKELMTEDVACCTVDTTLEEVAKMMISNDCGEIPVLESERSKKLAGVITDRDIVCRSFGEGKNPLEMSAGDCMTSEVITVGPTASMEECCDLMEQHQIRRIPVVNSLGECCGIVAQADVALSGAREKTADVVRQVSEK